MGSMSEARLLGRYIRCMRGILVSLTMVSSCSAVRKDAMLRVVFGDSCYMRFDLSISIANFPTYATHMTDPSNIL